MTMTRRPAWLFSTVQGYHRKWILRDVLAGLSAGAVVIPQGMAYATIANLPVQVGLYTCIVPMLVYAFLGESRDERLDDIDDRDVDGDDAGLRRSRGRIG